MKALAFTLLDVVLGIVLVRLERFWSHEGLHCFLISGQRSERLPYQYCTMHNLVTVWISSATWDLMLIQQNKFYWISNRSRVAELIQTVTHNFCWISNIRSGVASTSTDIFWAVLIWYSCPEISRNWLLIVRLLQNFSLFGKNVVIDNK